MWNLEIYSCSRVLSDVISLKFGSCSRCTICWSLCRKWRNSVPSFSFTVSFTESTNFHKDPKLAWTSQHWYLWGVHACSRDSGCSLYGRPSVGLSQTTGTEPLWSFQYHFTSDPFSFALGMDAKEKLLSSVLTCCCFLWRFHYAADPSSSLAWPTPMNSPLSGPKLFWFLMFMYLNIWAWTTFVTQKETNSKSNPMLLDSRGVL